MVNSQTASPPAGSKRVRLVAHSKDVRGSYKIRVFSFSCRKKHKEIFKQIYAYKHKGWNKAPDELRGLKERIDSDPDFNVLTDIQMPTLPANLNEGLTEAILRGLIRLSKRFKQQEVSHSDLLATRVWVVGPVGSGKTTFLNAMFSMHHQTLRNEQVVWVRLSLVEDPMRNLGIEKGLSWRTAQTLCKYYGEELGLEDDAELVKIANSLNAQARSEPFTLGGIKHLLDLYKEPQYNPILTPQYSVQFQTLISERARNAKMSFIYIIDGLDQLETDDAFGRLTDEVYTYVFSARQLRGAVLLVARDESFAKIVTFERLHRFFGAQNMPKILQIEAPTISEILRRRERLIQGSKGLENLPPAVSKLQKDKELRRRLLYEIALMCAWLESGLLMKPPKHARAFTADYSALDSLEKVFGVNRRDAVSLFPVLYHRFCETCNELKLTDADMLNIVESVERAREGQSTLRLNNIARCSQQAHDQVTDILSRHYHVLELLLCREYDRYQHKWSHEMKPDGQVHAKHTDAAPYVVSILKPANIADGQPHKFNLLSIWYILTMLNTAGDNGLYRSEIREKISAAAPCISAAEIDCDIEQLYKDGFIQTDIANWDQGEGQPLYLALPGRHAIEVLLLENAYLQNVIFDMYVPSSCASDFVEHPERIFGKTSRLSREVQPAKWVAYYMLQVTKLIKLIVAVEKRDSLNLTPEPLGASMKREFTDTMQRIARSNLQKDPNFRAAITQAFDAYGIDSRDSSDHSPQSQ